MEPQCSGNDAATTAGSASLNPSSILHQGDDMGGHAGGKGVQVITTL